MPAKRLSFFGKIISLLLACSIIFSVSACSAGENSVAPLILPSNTPNSIPSIIQPPFTPTTIPSAIPTSQKCWDTKPLSKATREIAGSLLYFDPDLQQRKLFDLSSLKSINTEIQGDISPDGKSIAEIDNDTNTFVLVTQFKNTSFPIPDNVYFYDGYLADDQIRFGVNDAREENYKQGVGTTDEYYLLSTDTGEITFQSIFLPNYYFSAFKNEDYFRTIYSPDLNYVIYPSGFQGTALVSVLFDISNQKIIWSGETLAPWSITGFWRFDSKSIRILRYDSVLGGDENFYDLFMNGKTQKITQFESYPQHDYWTWPDWSPDGRYFAYRNWIGGEGYLIIVDTESNIVLNPCLPLGNLNFPQFWSPDSKGFAIMPRGMTTIVIVDLVDQVIYEAYKWSGKDFVDPYAKPNQDLLDFDGWLSWELP